MAFHDRLKQARERAQLTQAQVASLLEVVNSTYSGYETGKSDPSANAIANLMQFLNTTPDFLWQDEMEGRFRNEYPERCFPLPDMYAQSRDEEELLRKYRTLTPSAKLTVLVTIRAFANSPDMQNDVDTSAMT